MLTILTSQVATIIALDIAPASNLEEVMRKGGMTDANIMDSRTSTIQKRCLPCNEKVLNFWGDDCGLVTR